jgi:hypothetical protein
MAQQLTASSCQFREELLRPPPQYWRIHRDQSSNSPRTSSNPLDAVDSVHRIRGKQ